jgi:hypothetical protein
MKRIPADQFISPRGLFTLFLFGEQKMPLLRENIPIQTQTNFL